MKSLKIISLLCLSAVIVISCNEVKDQKESADVTDPAPLVEEIEPVLNQKLTAEQQITAAMLAAPEEARAGAKIYGYDPAGNFVTLREGSSDMICIADDPNRDGFEVVSYHESLDPYMARGRALKAEGKSFVERRDMREKEATEGSLKMPSKPATLHIFHGEKGWFDIDSSKVRNAKYRYVVYIPFATQASTGLSLKPNAPGHPWLMFPGKANAHIMITPPEEN